MSAFKIVDKNDEAIRINKLDEEAAAFWGKEVHPKRYAFPGTSPNNWFDVIGWAIAHQGNYTSGWKNIALCLFEDIGAGVLNHGVTNIELTSEEELIKHIRTLKDIYNPFIALMNHWAAKGYKPIQIKE